MTLPPEPTLGPGGIDPIVPRVAMQPPGRAPLAKFGARTVVGQQTRRFRQYVDQGLSFDDAGALAAAGDLPPAQVAKAVKQTQLHELGRDLARLADQDPEGAYSRWEGLGEKQREDLRELGLDLDPLAPPKQSGFFSVPVIGAAAKKTLQAGAWAAEKFNDVTMGYAGKGLGKTFDFLDEASERIVQRPYRTLEYNIREKGFVSGVWHGMRGYEAHEVEDGERSWRPGTYQELSRRTNNNRALVELVRDYGSGMDNEEILTKMGFTIETEEWANEFAALDRIRSTDEFKSLADYAESQKMSPGRAVSNAVGLDDNSWLSGTVDGTWRMIVDPALVVGSASRGMRGMRLLRFDFGANAAEQVAEALGDVGHLTLARFMRQADGQVINPLRHREYFQGLRKLAGDYTPEQLEVVMLMDHVLAGTRAGGRLGDDGVAEVMGQYQRLRPKNTAMVKDLADRVAKGEIFDEATLAASLRNGVLIDAMAEGVGRSRRLDHIPGLFMPRLTNRATVKMQGKLLMDRAFDWSLASPFKFKAGEAWDASNMVAAKVWLSETMRRNRGEGQSQLDDFVDFAEAMRRHGFDNENIRDVINLRLVDELDGRVLDGETPIHSLARAVTRDGKMDHDAVELIEDTLRSFYPDDAARGQQLVDAFQEAGERYFARFRDGGDLAYVDTLLDDALLDDNLKELLAGFDEAYDLYVARREHGRVLADEAGAISEKEPWTILSRQEFADEVFAKGFFSRTKHGFPDDGKDPFGGISALRKRFRDRPIKFIDAQGAERVISRPEEYLELLGEIGYEAIRHRSIVADAGDIILHSKIRSVGLAAKTIVRRGIRPIAMTTRMIPKHGFIDFDSAEGITELRRWLDLGVYGKDADRLVGEFIAAGTEAQRRSVLFSAQRKMLEDTGILYDPNATQWVKSVLAHTQQYYGGGLMIDSANRARVMALFPEGQHANKVRLVDPEILMSHMQRSKLMELFSPRFGTLGIRKDGRIIGGFGSDDGRTLIQRINRFWRPAAVLSPRLILRAGLDELLTTVAKDGLVGERGYFTRLLRSYTMQAQTRRWQQHALDAGRWTPEALARSTVEVAGELTATRTATDVARMVEKKADEIAETVAELRRIQPDVTPEELARYFEREAELVAGSLRDISRGLIDRGFLAEDRRLWELTESELYDVLTEADRAQMFMRQRPVLYREGKHLTEAGSVIERLADGFLHQMGQRFGIPDPLRQEAAMAMALDPTVVQARMTDVTHVGVHQDVKTAAADDFALMGDAEELGFLGLADVKGAERATIQADVNDFLGRQGLVATMNTVQKDQWGRNVLVPAWRSQLTKGKRDELVGALPTRELRAGPLGDPRADDVVDGMLAPAVKAAVDEGDQVLAHRLLFVTLPDEAQDAVWSRLDGSDAWRAIDRDPNASYSAYRARLADLGIGDGSMLALDQAEYGEFLDLLHRLDSDQAWQVAINDAAFRPGGTVDAATRLRVGADGVFYARSSDLHGTVTNRLISGEDWGHTGPGIRLTADDGARAGGNDAVDSFIIQDRDARVYGLRSRDPLPDDLVADLVDGSTKIQDELRRILRGTGIDPGVGAFALDGSPESIQSFLSELGERIQLVTQATDFTSGYRLADAVRRHFFDVWRKHGVAAFADSPGGMTSLAKAFGSELPSGTKLSIFDSKVVGKGQSARPNLQARLEMGFAGPRYDEQMNDWIDLLRGEPVAGNRLVHDRARDHLVNTPYWKHTRGHDMMGPDNGVRAGPQDDELILHVPRRKGDRPEIRTDADEAATTLGEASQAFGAVDPDVASRYLKTLAAKHGDEIDMWELTELPVKRGSLQNRRDRPEELLDGTMAPAGADVAEVGPLADRVNDQLLRVDRVELDAVNLVADPGDEQLLLAIAHPTHRAGIANDWHRSIDTTDLDGRLGELVNVDDGIEALTAVGRDGRALQQLAARQPEQAVEAALAALADTAGDVLTRRQMGPSGAAAALRSHADTIGRTHAVRTRIYDDIADMIDQGVAVPDWWRFDAFSQRSAQVFKGKRIRTAGDQLVDEVMSNLPSMLSDSHKGAPLYELLGAVERGTFKSNLVDNYHGALPAKTIRPKMKPIDERPTGWRWSDNAFQLITKGIANIARNPMFTDEYVMALHDARSVRRVTQTHARRTEHFKGRFGDEFDDFMLRFEADLVSMRDGHPRAMKISELDPKDIGDFARMYAPIPDGELDDLARFLDAEHELRVIERGHALQRSLDAVTPYIDDHRVRSQFAELLNEVVPFFYATEQFIKRWARTAYHSPEGFRRLQLYYHGLHASGRVFTDENGDDVFEYPLTGFLTQTLGYLFGSDVGELTPNVNLRGRTRDVLPGLDDSLRFGAGPAMLAPLSMMRRFMPQEVATFEEFLGGERAVGRDLFDVFLPASITRFADFANWSDDALNSRNAIGAMAYIEANRPELVPGPDATEEEISAYMDNIRQVSRALGLARGLVGFVGAAAPRIELDPDELNHEYVSLLDAGLPIDEALGEFLARHPEATAYTVFATETSSGAPVDPTHDVWQALDEHDDFYKAYRKAGPWLLPYDNEGRNEFHAAAWSEMVAIGYRNRKSGEDWYADLKFAQGSQLYFPSSEKKERALANAPTAQAREEIRQKWRLWLDDFELRHPLFMRELKSQEGVSNRQEIREEMRRALTDPKLPARSQTETIRRLLAGWDELQSILVDHLAYDVDTRKAASQAFHQWARRLTAGDFMTQAFYDRAMLRDIEIVADIDTGVASV